MTLCRCPVCHDIVLIVMTGEPDPDELANKQAAHDITKAHI